MFKVTHGKVRFKGVFYGEGEDAGTTISGLSDDQIESLVAKGYGESIKVQVEEKEAVIPGDLNITEVEELITKTDDLNTLYEMLEFEEANKKRKGVIKPLEEKIVKLEESEGKEETEGINIDLNPDDVIEDAQEQG